MINKLSIVLLLHAFRFQDRYVFLAWKKMKMKSSNCVNKSSEFIIDSDIEEVDEECETSEDEEQEQ